MRWNRLFMDVSYERNIGEHFIGSVGVEDIFNNSRSHAVNVSPTLIYDIWYEHYNPAVWCKLTYKFANKRKAKTDQLKNNNEIIKRM